MGRSLIFKDFVFEAAHYLPNVPKGHKCGRLHGHSYRYRVWVSGEVDPITGFIVDFGDLKRTLQPIYDTLDHHFLNDIVGLDNPTAENLSRWIFEECKKLNVQIKKVEVFETCTSGAIYEE